MNFSGKRLSGSWLFGWLCAMAAVAVVGFVTVPQGTHIGRYDPVRGHINISEGDSELIVRIFYKPRPEVVGPFFELIIYDAQITFASDTTVYQSDKLRALATDHAISMTDNARMRAMYESGEHVIDRSLRPLQATLACGAVVAFITSAWRRLRA